MQRALPELLKRSNLISKNKTLQQQQALKFSSIRRCSSQGNHNYINKYSNINHKKNNYNNTKTQIQSYSTIMGTIFGKESVEEPAFTVLMERTSVPTPYELRQYSARMAAETSMSSDGSNDSAFRTLASYIGVFGKPENEGQTSIAMTAPVVMERPGDNEKKEGAKIAMTAPVVMEENKSKMQFMLPAEYNSKDHPPPHPTNPAVTIVELPPSVGVTHRYSGSFSKTKSHDVATKLVKQLNDDGIVGDNVSVDEYQFWGYNPPFTLPMFRRNEVWIPLTQEQADELVNTYTGTVKAEN